jgi:hypothetical protein
MDMEHDGDDDMRILKENMMMYFIWAWDGYDT